MLDNILLKETKDIYGTTLHELWVDNGTIKFSLILERGMEIGQVFLRDTCMSWKRDESFKLHPQNVDLKVEGWEKGFYSAVAVLGPEVFGTPDKNVTVHGTGSYSIAKENSLKIRHCGSITEIEANVPIQGYANKQIHQKKVLIQTKLNSNFIIRREVSVNLSDEKVPLDDGYHVQFAGEYLSQGGRYILPVATDKMLLRDSAPIEDDPKTIYPFIEVLEPIRCYQYVPEKVYGLDKPDETGWIDFIQNNPDNLTAEMLVNNERSKGAIIIRPLDCFPRTLIAKRNEGCAMYAIEPCKTRPNSLRQKAIDGELQYLSPKEERESFIAFGFFDDEASIKYYEKRIESAANYEKELVQVLF